MFKPNLFILGAAKCGTTTLHAYLSEMPEVCMSYPKEPFFFECEFEKGISFYQKQYFSHWQGEEIIGESRHRNLYLPFVAHRIFEINPDAKLLVAVRNPVERAFSHWQHWYGHGREQLRFPDAIQADYSRLQSGLYLDTKVEIARYCEAINRDARRSGYGIYRTYLDSGFYAEQITRYLQYYPEDQLHVILFEDLINDPIQTIRSLRLFLGLDQDNFTPEYVIHKNLGATLVHRKILSATASIRKSGIIPEKIKILFERALRKIEPKYTIDQQTRAWLSQFYHEPNHQLASLLHRNLSHWT